MDLFHQPNATSVYYTTCQHVALYSIESFPNLIFRPVQIVSHAGAEYQTAWVTVLYFHNKPLIPNIWTTTLLDQHKRFSRTLSPTCNYWSIQGARCVGDTAQTEQLWCSTNIWDDWVRPVPFLRFWFEVIQGMKKPDFRRQLQGWWEKGCVHGSQSDSSPLEVMAHELLRRRKCDAPLFHLLVSELLVVSLQGCGLPSCKEDETLFFSDVSFDHHLLNALVHDFHIPSNIRSEIWATSSSDEVKDSECL